MSDPRLILLRNGEAAAGLEGVHPARRYRETTATMVVAPSAPLRSAPDPAAEQDDQLLFGEAFEVLDLYGEWAFGQAARDGYVGWVPAAALRAGRPCPTHRVSALRTFAFADPNVRSPTWGPLCLNALVRVEACEGRFVRIDGAGWVAADHVAPIGVYETDPAAVALRYRRAPYHWGGRDSLGLDCSGLVQQAFYACGVALPRDADQQQACGVPIARADLRRNDLVFWKGHVGLMVDAELMVHANSHHIAVEIEPLDQAIPRKFEAGDGPPTAFRRIG